MKNLKKKDYIYCGILLITLLLIIAILIRNGYIYGSAMDWRTQHFTLPEYFRNLFYSTKDLFPNFAFNIGGGQNIYFFAYYGLFNPIILISYLLPFISMSTFISISSIFVVAISTLMFYKFLKNHHCSAFVAFLASFVFLCSGPLIFHSHRHIMFINYMPFLILGLFGVDKYFKDNKRWLLTLSIFLIILTSYYYSVTSLLVLLIYGIYCYLKANDKITFIKFIKDGLRFLTCFIVGVLSATFLLLPIIYVILQGRGDVALSYNIASLLIPTLKIDFLLYTPYSIGLSAISFLAIISLLFKKSKEKIFLGITCLLFIIFPILTYLLNGGMYLSPKVLIPMIPLICFILAMFLNNLIDKKEEKLKYAVYLSLILLMLSAALIPDMKIKYAIIDMIVIVFFIYLYNKTNNKFCLSIPIVALSFIVCLGVNNNDELVKRNIFNKDFNKINNQGITSIINKEPNLYRLENQMGLSSNFNRIINDNHYTSSVYSSLSNKLYNNFYFNIFKNEIPFRNNAMTPSTQNILFQTYMGVKYTLTNSPSIGYEKTNINNIYENNYTLPIGYASNKILSTKEFNKLKYPYTVDALLNYTIIDTKKPTTYTPTISPITLNYKMNKTDNLSIKKDDIYRINSDGIGKLSLQLDQVYQNKIIIIKFKMLKSQSCRDGDTSITINGVKNKLTCKSWKYHNQNYNFEYVLSKDNIKNLDIVFDKGEYLIDDIKTYIMDYDDVKQIKATVDELYIDKEKTKGDNLYGEIKVKEDGYLNLSIPYDKGFKIYLNNKLQDYEKVDTSFMGIPIKSGNYDVKITYEAPLSKLGQIISIVGISCFIIIIVYDKKKGVRNENNINNRTVL